tara:strand:- start:422 stop:625 length:204 start_codon:yes stop_codon:yes gene_type:complete
MHLEKKIIGARVGLIVDIFEKKVFRGPGNIVNWDDIDPEPHAAVLYAHNDGTINIPAVELQVVDEAR